MRNANVFRTCGGSNRPDAPAGVPHEIVDKFSSCLEKLVVDPEFLKVVKQRALLISFMNAKQTTEWYAKESVTLKALRENMGEVTG
jgi:tripartite-type tricarboxylate transporter receptor subunit TctC